MTDLVRLSELLSGWMVRQRWYAGKGRPDAVVTLGDLVDVVPDRPGLAHAVVKVGYGDGPPERYSVLLGVRDELPDRLEYAALGELDGEWWYDAVHDPELMEALLENMAEDATVGDLEFRHLPETSVETGLSSRMVTAEQSNTSVVYADRYILKLFRRVAPGINPDLEITRALALAGSPHVATPYGWIQGRLDGQPTTLGLLQHFFVSATEGWALATTSVRDLYAEADLHADEVGGDFAAEARRLGAATAQVHQTLAGVLPTESAGPAQLAEIAVAMHERLDRTVLAVPALAPHAERLHAAYDRFADYPGTLTFQRIHGDYHLGQVLRTDTGWVILDFEGEPARPLTERIKLDSPLRDVAGMLRSFDYAARFLLEEYLTHPGLAYRAGEWAERNRSAFCAGYADAAGYDPLDEPTLIQGYELDKAVYEVMYEARHRPTWLAIPLGSIERLVERT